MSRVVSLLFVLLLGLVVMQQVVSAFQPSPRVDELGSKHSDYYKTNSHKQQEKPKKYFNTNNNNNNNDNDYENVNHKNETDERIHFSEPYKYLIQSTVRYALLESGAPSHVNIDTAMDLINDTSFALAKPSVLAKVAKVLAVVLATLFTSTFLFPNAIKYIDSAWKDPSKLAKTIERYLPNGANERAMINMIGSTAQDLLSKIGLTDPSCVDQSVCQAGELMRCASPQLADSIIKFLSDHFSRLKYKQVWENKHVKAFLSGFEEQNCSPLADTTQKNCFGNSVSSYLLSKCNLVPMKKNEKPKVEYQTLTATHA